MSLNKTHPATAETDPDLPVDLGNAWDRSLTELSIWAGLSAITSLAASSTTIASHEVSADSKSMPQERAA
jgi:hypothetical protein